MSRAVAGHENYEHVLMCLICRSLFDDHEHQPKFLPCHHTFCKECLRQYVQQMGDDIECPSCRRVATIPAAGVSALQTNFYAKYIQSLVYGCSGINPSWVSDCERHPGRKLQHYCNDCALGICDVCLKERGCARHECDLLTAVMERCRCDIDSAFSGTNSLIENKKVELEGLLKSLAEAKDRSLIKIESTFEQHVHALTRRATLLKNKVIGIYNEHATKVEADLEEISTGMTCAVSLKEHHESMIGRGDFSDARKGVEELHEIRSNLLERIQPKVHHVRFDEEHGSEAFHKCVTVLGRVVSLPNAFQSSLSQNSSESSVQSPEIDPKATDSYDVISPEGDPKGKVYDMLSLPCSESVPEPLNFCAPSNFKSEMVVNIHSSRPVDVITMETERELNNNPGTMMAIRPDQGDVMSIKDPGRKNADSIVAGMQCSVIVTFASEPASHDRCPVYEVDKVVPVRSCVEHRGTPLPPTTILNAENVKEVLGPKEKPFTCSDSASAEHQRRLFAPMSKPRDGAKTCNFIQSNAEHFAGHKSYDESSLRSELGCDVSDGEDVSATPSKQMSRSDFWLMMSSSIESLSEHDLIVAELSGEQTSL